MARKTPPSEHLARLKGLYDQQREKLVALAAAEDAVTAAEEAVAADQQRLKDAETNAESAYQALVDVMGVAGAAQVTGRRSGKRVTSARKAPEDRQEQPTEAALAEPDAAQTYA